VRMVVGYNLHDNKRIIYSTVHQKRH
jgi:hypothetical protein